MSTRNWDDLKPRVMSALVMAAVGAFSVWSGGLWFIALIAISSGLMMWELVRMIAPVQTQVPTQSHTPTRALVPVQTPIPIQMGVISALAVTLSALLPVFYLAPLLLAPVLIGVTLVKERRGLFVPYALLILLAGYGFIYLRQDLGLIWMLWLLLVVIISDVGGYLAGRMLGGPKFWPAISPKKTWSGTVAGWIGAALIGFYFSSSYDLWGGLALVSVLVAFAAQMGDIAESAIKRKTGIKDSSNLIPGHGGFMDRFDGMLGASVLVVLLVLLTGFPFGAG